MCGIVGFTGQNNPDLLTLLTRMIDHRGPDEAIIWTGDSIQLGMTRLAIQDLHPHLYPMKYDQMTLVFNGEIYNYHHLKQYLKKKYDYQCRTRCDAEIILPLFQHLGDKMLSKLEGMFSLAIYNKSSQEVWLARDRMGEKPLYYQYTKQGLVFASELKVILEWRRRHGQSSYLNHDAIASWFTQGFVASPDTLVDGVSKLEAGYWLKYSVKTNQLRTGSYWTLPFAKISQAINENESYLDNLLEQSVKQRLIADVPVGCFLSGGVDSSLIAYYASLHQSSLKTFSVSFPGSGHYDESRFSRRVAVYLGADHTEIPVMSQDLLALFSRIGFLTDEPIVDAAMLPTFILSQVASKQVKVVLTGEGADEVFGGYHRYQKELFAQIIRGLMLSIPGLKEWRDNFLPYKFEKIFSDLSFHYGAQTIWRKRDLQKLLHQDFEFNPAVVCSSHLDDSLLWMQLSDMLGYLPEQLLMKVDKMTMSHSLEARAPYLDPQVVLFGLQLSQKNRLHGIHGKYLLKKIASSHLPNDIVWRIKHGFSVPLSSWFRHELKPAVYDTLEQTQLWHDWFDRAYFQEIVAQHIDGQKNETDKIWSVILLKQWMEAYGIKP